MVVNFLCLGYKTGNFSVTQLKRFPVQGSLPELPLALILFIRFFSIYFAGFYTLNSGFSTDYCTYKGVGNSENFVTTLHVGAKFLV